MYTLLYHVIVA